MTTVVETPPWTSDITMEGRCNSASVGIVGAGAAGAAAAAALVARRAAARVLLHDLNRAKCLAQVLDLQDAAFFGAARVHTAELPDIAGCGVVLLAAGAKTRPGETRDVLLERNAAMLRAVAAGLWPAGAAPANPATVFIIISNPVDALTALAQALAPLPPAQVMGAGTLLDSVRLRVEVAALVGVAPASVRADVLGEHGDSQVALWSAASVGGAPAAALPALQSPTARAAAADAARRKAYAVVAGKGATQFGIGEVAAELAECVLFDRRAIFPLSVRAPALGNTVLGWPAVLGRAGAEAAPEPALSPEERAALEASAAKVRAAVARVSAPVP
jgi:L-lactate dehydrogenase